LFINVLEINECSLNTIFCLCPIAEIIVFFFYSITSCPEIDSSLELQFCFRKLWGGCTDYECRNCCARFKPQVEDILEY